MYAHIYIYIYIHILYIHIHIQILRSIGRHGGQNIAKKNDEISFFKKMVHWVKGNATSRDCKDCFLFWSVKT